MLSFFEIIKNKRISIKLQLSQFIDIQNVFYFNLILKALTNLLINLINNLLTPIIVNNNKK